MVEVEVDYTIDDLKQFSKRELKRTGIKPLILSIVIFLVCAVVMFFINIIYSIVLLLICILFPLFLIGIINGAAKKNYENNFNGAKFKYTFEEDKLILDAETKTLTTNVSAEYNKIPLVTCYDNAYYIYFEQGRAYLLPKRFLSYDDNLTVYDLLSKVKDFKVLK